MKKTETAALEWADFIYLREALKKELSMELRELTRSGLARLAAGIVMGCYFGLRFSDLSRITWKQIVGKNSLRLKEQKTGKVRNIDIHEFVNTYVSECLQACPDINLKEPVLSNRHGESMSTEYFNRQLRKIFDRYKIRYQNASSHTLRKTFGRKVYINAGQNHEALLLLMKMFNHETTFVTAKYIGIEREAIKSAYINLD